MPHPVALLGMPFDAFSSHLRGPAEAPEVIRRVLHNGSSGLCAENGYELAPENGFSDAGDVHCEQAAEDFETLRERVRRLIAAGHRVLTIGGDHSITFPIIEAHAETFGNLTILHFDAHPDLYDELDGDRWSHACPFARIMESELASRLVQIGIRTATAHQRAQAERFGVETITADGWDGTLPGLDDPVYVTIDLDAIDPSEAPGVSHHEPGGLRVRQILRALHELDRRGVDVVGVDIVELNPSRDLHSMTAAVAAKLLRESIGILASRNAQIAG